MEGGTYDCSWKRIGKRFRLWVADRPEIEITDAKFDQAEIKLSLRICEVLGDGEAVLRFDPPAPASAISSHFLRPHWVEIVGNTSSDLPWVSGSFPPYAPSSEMDQLFTGGWCFKCGRGIGARTAEPLTLKLVESGHDGGFALLELAFYSSGFLELLTTEERGFFEWREVRVLKRSRQRFYELIPKTAVETVPARGFNSFECTACTRCDRANGWVLFRDEIHINNFIRRTDLPKAPAFSLGSGVRCICLPHARWKALKGRPGTKGLAVNDLGMVDDHQVDSDAPIYTVENRDLIGEESLRLDKVFRAEFEAPRPKNSVGGHRDWSPSETEVFWSRYGDDLTTRRIGRRLGIPEWKLRMK